MWPAKETAARYASKERARQAKSKLRETFMRYIGTSDLKARDHWKFDTQVWVGLDGSKIWTSTLEVYNFPNHGSGLVTRGWGWSELEAEGAAAERLFEDPGVEELQKNLVPSMAKFAKDHLQEAIETKGPNETTKDRLRTMYAEQQFQGKRFSIFDGNAWSDLIWHTVIGLQDLSTHRLLLKMRISLRFFHIPVSVNWNTCFDSR